MSLWNLLGAGGALAAGLGISEEMRQTGRAGAEEMRALGERMAGETAFRGYGVQTGLGRSQVSPTGGMDLGVGPQAGLMQGGQ